MGKNRQQAGLVNVINYDENNNLSLSSSPSSSIQTSGSVVATSITGSFTGSVFGIGDTSVFSSSVNSRVSSIEGTNTFTSSASARLNSIEAVTASNLNRLTSLENKTGSLASTGSNTFYGTQTISGTVYIANDLIVQGSSSIQNITGSSVNIGTNKVVLNTANPAVRYGGISVIDSGSTGLTGSILWDSTNNNWLYQNPSASSYVSAKFISGPQSQTLGSEPGLITNFIQKAVGDDHISSSAIYDDGNTVSIKSNTEITGSLNAKQGRFKDWYTAGSGIGLEVGLSSNVGNVLTYDRTNSRYYPLQLSGGDGNGGNASYIQITTNGVGIGTASPQATLHISSSAGSTNGLRIEANSAYEILITGSDSANIYHASPNQAIYLNTNGGLLHLGTSAASTLFTISGSNVGIGITNPTALLQVRGPNAVGTFFDAQNTGAGGATFSRINASSFPYNQYTFANGNVGIGTDSPANKLIVYDTTNLASGWLSRFVNTYNNTEVDLAHASGYGLYVDAGNNTDSSKYILRAAANTAVKFTVQGDGKVGIGMTNPSYPLDVSGNTRADSFLAINDRNYFARGSMRLTSATNNASTLDILIGDTLTNIYGNYYSGGNDNTIVIGTYANNSNQLVLKTSGNVGIKRLAPLATLAVYGGAFQLMGDYANHQIIVKTTGTAGTLNGALTITVSDMAGAGGSIGYGGYSCEVYVAGYSGMYCHAWFSGYTNSGVTPSETAILRSNGGWSVSQVGTGNQGFIFTIDYPSGLIHPTARIIFNKGGHAYENEYNANNITAVWS